MDLLHMSVSEFAEIAMAAGMSPSALLDSALRSLEDGALSHVHHPAYLSQGGQRNVPLPVEVVQYGALR